MSIRSIALLVALFIGVSAGSAGAFDHPGHMTTAAIAFYEIERTRPELIEKIGKLLLAHPDPAPFWVAAGDARGNERTRRMFIEAARWPDDSKWTPNDRPSWHSARWAIVAKDAPPEAQAAAEARHGEPVGQAIEAVELAFGTVSNPETGPAERARSLCWVLHIVGDLHQPLHVSDFFSKEFPLGNAAGTLSYVDDPLRDSTIPLHILWDSNTMRSTELQRIDRHVEEFVKKYPRSSFPELTAQSEPAFREWARESYQVAVDFAYGYGIETVSDPNTDLDADRLVKNMVAYILEGISPVEEAPELPAEYWERLQDVSHRRLTLAGYRIADLIIAAANEITAQRKFVGR
jgi:hypothetical protein